MLYRVVEENLRRAMRCYARVCPAGEARDYPGMTVASSGINYAVFNSAMLTEPATEPQLRRLIALASTHFKRRELGWTFWVCHDLLDAQARARVTICFEDADMQLIAQPPGMHTEGLLPEARTLPRLDFRRVDNPSVRHDFAALSSSVFTLPYPTACTVYENSRVWNEEMRGWVAYWNGEPVSIATVVIAAGVAGVYSVGTVPSFQCRGFAEALMRHALSEVRAETGVEATVLQSTSQGLGLYKRLGYEIVTKFAVYLKEGGNAS